MRMMVESKCKSLKHNAVISPSTPSNTPDFDFKQVLEGNGGVLRGIEVKHFKECDFTKK